MLEARWTLARTGSVPRKQVCDDPARLSKPPGQCAEALRLLGHRCIFKEHVATVAEHLEHDLGVGAPVPIRVRHARKDPPALMQPFLRKFRRQAKDVKCDVAKLRLKT